MNVAIILSGGTGTRLGANIPKQYIEVGCMPIITYCLKVFAAHPMINGLVVVAASEWVATIQAQIDALHIRKSVVFANPGSTRQLSILNGLNKAKSSFSDIENVIIHDAARPLVSAQLITDCLMACDEYDGSMPVLPVKDTIYQSNDGTAISGLLNRSTLFAGQAPEAFRFDKYLEAHSSLSTEEILKINGSSEIAYKTGMRIKMVQGDVMNFKITDSTDLQRFKDICNESKCTL